MHKFVPEGTRVTRLVLGSRNKKKLREMLDLLGDLGLDLTDLTPYPGRPGGGGDRRHVRRQRDAEGDATRPGAGAWVIGEDSGLVRAGARRCAGRVLGALRRQARRRRREQREAPRARWPRLTGDDRAAYYVSTAVLADPTGKVVAAVEGRCHGVIVDEPRGTGGFGYDPLFLVPEYGKTFGELPPEVKQSMSHRARAFAQLRPV